MLLAMEYWEFLIQKEGDRAWLPLESPDVEILEGRYRVVARSERANEAVEIRVTHDCTDEVPPKRRVQKRSRRTSAEGLVVVIPFTRLKPGLWELRCSGGDVMSDLMGSSWQQSVKLEVLPIDEDAAPLESNEPALSESADLPEVPAMLTEDIEPATPEPTVTQPIVSPVRLVPMKPAAQRLQAIINNSEEESDNSRDLPDEPAATTGSRQPLQLILNRTTYMVRQGQPLTVSGRVDVADGVKDALPLRSAEVHIQLRDPQSSQLVMSVRQSLPQIQPPVPFAYALEIPVESDTRLILGQISVYDGSPDALDTKSFTITADVEDLLGAISEELSDQDVVDLSEYPYPKHHIEALHQSFSELVDTMQNPQPVQFQPSTDRVLPPLLHKPEAGKTVSKPLDLPTFSRPNAPNSKVVPINRTQKGVEAPAETSETPQETLPAETQPNLEVLPNRAEAETAEVERPEMRVVQEPPAAAPSSPVDAAFKSLKLPERFWTRLNALANDEELSEWLKTEVSSFQEASPSEESEIEPAESPPQTVSEWEAREIVVDDEPLEPARPSNLRRLRSINPPTPEEANPALLPEDEPVPAPVLEVPKENLVAGRPVKVAVRLPEIVPRIYVKVWLQDRQARSVLDGPYWLTEFSSSIWGELEATVELAVPYGSLDVQVEAVAMEMQTQRESRKVSVERRVVPPAPPSLPLENE
ncbi:hypothetical protein [Microcoleus sp. FACHB-68]|uniref:hypothetical protein n=1 Tax=Microcoleus sp. FACHB-68 TaxID=2692826 RepID=UPI001689BCAF|nr:hypothetical protein [Microcoleus sp. FACHB-68]